MQPNFNGSLDNQLLYGDCPKYDPNTANNYSSVISNATDYISETCYGIMQRIEKMILGSSTFSILATPLMKTLLTEDVAADNSTFLRCPQDSRENAEPTASSKSSQGTDYNWKTESSLKRHGSEISKSTSEYGSG